MTTRIVLVDDHSIGGSIYDWNSMGNDARATMDRLFADGGAAADLPEPS